MRGPDARVRLFGSHTDDAARGGDIDLHIEIDQPLDNRVAPASRLAGQRQIRLDNQRIDVIDNWDSIASRGSGGGGGGLHAGIGDAARPDVLQEIAVVGGDLGNVTIGGQQVMPLIRPIVERYGESNPHCSRDPAPAWPRPPF